MRRSDTVLEGAQPISGDGSGEVLDTEDAVQTVLDAFEDADCRAILDRTSDESLTASEVATACDLPLSTTYRKLKLLTDARLLEEETPISHNGKHATEYRRIVEDVIVSLDSKSETVIRTARKK